MTRYLFISFYKFLFIETIEPKTTLEPTTIKPTTIVPTTKRDKDDPCPLKGIDYHGYDISLTRNVATWQECSEICKSVSNCLYWSWVDQDYATASRYKECFVKTSKAGREIEIGGISGTRNCEGRGRLLTLGQAMHAKNENVLKCMRYTLVKSCYFFFIFTCWRRGTFYPNVRKHWHWCIDQIAWRVFKSLNVLFSSDKIFIYQFL